MAILHLNLLSRQLKFTTAGSQKNLNRKNIILRFNIADSSKDLVRYERNTSPNFILWNWNLGGLRKDTQEHLLGGYFWPWPFMMLKSSHQDLSNEGSNFILTPLGNWVAQTKLFLTNYGFYPQTTISDKAKVLNFLTCKKFANLLYYWHA